MTSGLGLAAFGNYAASPEKQAQLTMRKLFPYGFLYQDAQQQASAADGQDDVPAYRRGGNVSAAALGAKGRGGDTLVAHINRHEAGLLRAAGGSGTRNPRTGLLEFMEDGATNDDAGGSSPATDSGTNDNFGSSKDNPGGIPDTAFGMGLMGMSEEGINSMGLTARDAQNSALMGFDEAAALGGKMHAAGYGQPGKQATGLASVAGKIGSLGLSMAGAPSMVAGPAIGIAKSGIDALNGKEVTGRDVATNIGFSSTPAGLGALVGHGLQAIAGALNLDQNPSPAPHSETSAADSGSSGADLTAIGTADDARRKLLESIYGSGGGAPQPVAGGGRIGGSGVGHLMHGSGMVPGDTSGRADQVPATLPQGGYVLPADCLSAIGDGNSLAGAKMLSAALRQFGKANVGHPKPTAVRVSGGEYAIHPAHAAAIGGGNLQAGHAVLDRIVQLARAKAARAATTLPGPK